MSKITIEIELPEKLEVYPEEGQSEDDFKSKEAKKKLESFRKKFTQDVHDSVEHSIKTYMDDFEDIFFDYDMDNISIEGWESLKDYGIIIKMIDEKGKQIIIGEENGKKSKS